MKRFNFARLFEKRFPFIHQHDSMQCGIACIQMVCAFYGKKYGVNRLEQIAPCTTEGISILSLSKATQKLGFKNECIRCSLDMLVELVHPSILHWNQNHYVVLYEAIKTRKGYMFRIADPGNGLRKVTEEEVNECWIYAKTDREKKGIVLVLEPTDAFFKMEDDCKEKNISFRFLLHYFVYFRHQLGRIMLGMAVGSFIQLLFPSLTQAVVDVGIKSKSIDFIYVILCAQVSLSIGASLLDYIHRWIMLHVCVKINVSMISDFIIKLFKMPMPFFDSKLTGDLMQRMRDYTRIQGFLTGAPVSLLFSFVSSIVLYSVLLGYSKKIFLVLIFFNAIYAVWICVFLNRRSVLDYESYEKQAISQNLTLELIIAMQEIKLQGCQKRRRWEWEDAQMDLFRINERGLKMGISQDIGSFLINSTKNIIITILSAKAVIDGTMTLGMMLAIQIVVGQLSGPVSQFINFIYSLQDIKISMERINEIQSKSIESADAYEIVDDKEINNSIVISKLSFKYDLYSPEFILSGIDFQMPQGKTTAIVGASGSGKTTLLKILLGYYSNYDGRILVGEKDLKNINIENWRKHCGVVMQEGKIFSDTIERNIAMEDVINYDRLIYAAKTANIYEYINKLPLKFQTKIGVNGKGQSVGQKQRLLLARVIYKNPPFVFLDEATNSLDATNEKNIIENLNDFFINKTVMIIAHRLSTIRKADNIIVMNHGKIVEYGTHQYLLNKKGEYYQLVKDQLEL